MPSPDGSPGDSVPVAVSVALCTRNGAEFVGAQVESILGQSLRPAEIVLSDDGSTDDTVEIVRRIVEAHAEAHGNAVALTVVVNPEPLGVTGNFESAMRVCANDLIALCDQDDVWREDRLERAAGEFARRPELLLLHSDARIVDRGGVPSGIGLFVTLGVSEEERRAIHDGDGFAVYIRRNLATGATTMVRRRLLDLALDFPREWVHDEWLAIVAAALGGADLVDDTLIDYRQHGANAIGATALTVRRRFAKLAEPRTARNARLLENSRILVDRLGALAVPVPASVLALAAGKVVHETFRSSLARSRPLRVVPIARALRRGDYARFGGGAQDAVRDLVQPAS
ncbi:glycosyltransferase family 2 protein [Marisediminicola sp. LYQ85]|uniref:glycosyltransferase family 2 protein n=1 Tax=Marisediminicola sp. LYQ85 TaxID=3391062 RepID=UPI003983CE91